MPNKSQAARVALARQGTYETPGGRSYLENLERLHPDRAAKRAVERVKNDDEAARRKKK